MRFQDLFIGLDKEVHEEEEFRTRRVQISGTS
jgi:hypothetical protein